MAFSIYTLEKAIYTLESATMKTVGSAIDAVDAALMEPLRAEVEKTLIYVRPGEGLDAKLIQGANTVGLDPLSFKVGCCWCCWWVE